MLKGQLQGLVHGWHLQEVTPEWPLSLGGTAESGNTGLQNSKHQKCPVQAQQGQGEVRAAMKVLLRDTLRCGPQDGPSEVPFSLPSPFPLPAHGQQLAVVWSYTVQAGAW